MGLKGLYNYTIQIQLLQQKLPHCLLSHNGSALLQFSHQAHFDRTNLVFLKHFLLTGLDFFLFHFLFISQDGISWGLDAGALCLLSLPSIWIRERRD